MTSAERENGDFAHGIHDVDVYLLYIQITRRCPEAVVRGVDALESVDDRRKRAVHHLPDEQRFGDPYRIPVEHVHVILAPVGTYRNPCPGTLLQRIDRERFGMLLLE